MNILTKYNNEKAKEEKRKIQSELLELGFRVDSKGFDYWAQAIQIVISKEKTSEWLMFDVYEQIAKNNNDTVSRVERAMRHSIENAKSKIQETFNYNQRIANQTFLHLYLIYNK